MSYITVQNAALLTGKSPRSLHRMAKEGQIRFARIKRDILLCYEDITGNAFNSNFAPVENAAVMCGVTRQTIYAFIRRGAVRWIPGKCGRKGLQRRVCLEDCREQVGLNSASDNPSPKLSISGNCKKLPLGERGRDKYGSTG